MITELVPSQAVPRSSFHVDLEGLRAMASDAIVKRGIAYFKENRVIELDWDARCIWATVEGSRPGSPYLVELSLDQDNEIAIQCDCPFEWEPVCKHAVAVLLAYGARQPVSRLDVRNATEMAVEARAERGRREVVVESVDAAQGYGTWLAHSLASASPSARRYRVQIRALDERINHCTCPDFAVNRLGTCKHIEAVLHRLRRGRGRKGGGARGGSHPLPTFVYLAWEGPNAPRVAVRRSGSLPPEQRQILDAHFDVEGVLRGALPHAFHRLLDAVDGVPGVHIGDDAVAHVRHVAEEAAQSERRERIRRAIRMAGNQLPGVRAHLYPYQVEGVAFLASNGRALLADDMGLGKTLQAIAAASWLREHEGVRHVLIVCPASLKHQWAREVERFTGCGTVVVQGSAAAREVQYRSRAAYTIINYELVVRDRAVIQGELAADLTILDEAQRIRNWRTKTAEAVKVLRSRYAFVLTGTPLENRLEDLYSLMQAVDPHILGPLWRFVLDFHVTDERGRVIGYRNLSELRRRLQPAMLRRDRRLVRDQLPERIEHRLDLPMTPRQKDLHGEALSAAASLAQILRRRPLTPSEERRLLASLQRARMACDAAGLIDQTTQGSPKLDELRALLEELCLEGGRKAVVFSEWERMTAMAEQVARSLGLGVVRLHGGVPTAKRGALLERFRDDASIQVLISTDAGGVGLNLQAASVLVNLDVPWSPAVLEQRVARVHRLGQAEPVDIFLLSSQDSYEQRVGALVAGKRELFVHTVTDEAAEDVVGLSKRAVELLAGAIDDETADQPVEAVDSAGGEDGSRSAGVDAGRADRDAERADTAPDGSERAHSAAAHPAQAVEDAYRAALTRVQSLLGNRVERVLVVGGGLLVVVDRLDERAEAAAEQASNGVAVAVIDTRTRTALERLGSASPFSGASVLMARAPEEERAGGLVAPLLAQAQRQLRSAEVLLAEQCVEDGLALIAQSLLAVVAWRAGRSRAPSRAEAPVWLHTEPAVLGVVSAEEVGLITRVLVLSQAQGVPAELAANALHMARALVAQPEGATSRAPGGPIAARGVLGTWGEAADA